MEFENKPADPKLVNLMLRGITRWPQSNLGGLLVHAEVLNNPPESWEQLGMSVLSSEQVDKIGRRLTLLHHSFGIPVGYGQYRRNGEKQLKEAEIQRLWWSIKSGIITTSLSYYYETNKLPLVFVALARQRGLYDPDSLEDLREFMEGERTTRQFQDFKAAIQIARDFLVSHKGGEISRYFKHYYRIKYSGVTSRPEFDITGDKYHLPDYNDPDFPIDCLYRVGAHILSDTQAALGKRIVNNWLLSGYSV